MKKILAIAMAVALCQGLVFAQRCKPVAEKEVKVNYIKDFERQVKDAADVQWFLIDSQSFKVVYTDADKSRQAMVFSTRGSETHYFVESKYYPKAVRDTVSHLFPGYDIREVWVRKVRGKMTYQAYIAKMGGFLWWKKEKAAKMVNWEVDGKYINAEEL